MDYDDSQVLHSNFKILKFLKFRKTTIFTNIKSEEISINYAKSLIATMDLKILVVSYDSAESKNTLLRNEISQYFLNEIRGYQNDYYQDNFQVAKDTRQL